MRFSLLGVVAALAVADAFLLPPEISAADSDIIKTLPFEDAVPIDERIVKLPCPGCPLRTDFNIKMPSGPVESYLKFEYKIVHDEEDRLYMNNVQIYPRPRVINAGFLQATEMIKSSDNTWGSSLKPMWITDYGISVELERPVTDSKEDQLNLLSIRVRILGIFSTPVPTIPIMEIKLLETPSHKLMIGDAITTEPKPLRPLGSLPPSEFTPSSDPVYVAQECTTLLCKWRAIVADRLSMLKGCGSKNRPAVAHVIPAHKTHGHHGRPHQGHRPNGPHRSSRHHHRHGLTRFLKSVVMHVVIPVLIGVMVGITASLLGMVVGHIVIFIWRALFRRGQRSQYAKVQQEVVVVEDVIDEAKGLMDHQGPPPVYEDVVVVEKASE
jgi:hypothetical protein